MQHVHSLLLGAPAQQDMTIINTTVKGKFVPLLESVVGRGTGRFIHGAYIVWTSPKMADLAHNSNRGFGVATVADSVRDRFMPGNGPQEAPRGNVYKHTLFHYSQGGTRAYGSST